MYVIYLIEDQENEEIYFKKILGDSENYLFLATRRKFSEAYNDIRNLLDGKLTKDMPKLPDMFIVDVNLEKKWGKAEDELRSKIQKEDPDNRILKKSEAGIRLAELLMNLPGTNILMNTAHAGKLAQVKKLGLPHIGKNVCAGCERNDFQPEFDELQFELIHKLIESGQDYSTLKISLDGESPDDFPVRGKLISIKELTDRYGLTPDYYISQKPQIDPQNHVAHRTRVEHDRPQLTQLFSSSIVQRLVSEGNGTVLVHRPGQGVQQFLIACALLSTGNAKADQLSLVRQFRIGSVAVSCGHQARQPIHRRIPLADQLPGVGAQQNEGQREAERDRLETRAARCRRRRRDSRRARPLVLLCCLFGLLLLQQLRCDLTRKVAVTSQNVGAQFRVLIFENSGHQRLYRHAQSLLVELPIRGFERTPRFPVRAARGLFGLGRGREPSEQPLQTLLLLTHQHGDRIGGSECGLDLLQCGPHTASIVSVIRQSHRVGVAPVAARLGAQRVPAHAKVSPAGPAVAASGPWI